MRVPISVTKENIAAGVAACQKAFDQDASGCACGCPIALAFTEAGFKEVCCGLFNVTYKGFKGQVVDGFVELPKKAQDFITDLSTVIAVGGDNNLKPFCFTITIK